MEHCTRVLFVTPSSSHQQFPLLFTYFWKIPPQTCLVEANPSTLEISPIVIHSSHTPLHLLKVWVLWVFWHKQKTVLPTFKYFAFNDFSGVFAKFQKVIFKPIIVENTAKFLNPIEPCLAKLFCKLLLLRIFYIHLHMIRNV